MKVKYTGDAKVLIPAYIRSKLGIEEGKRAEVWYNENQKRLELQAPAPESQDWYLPYEIYVKNGSFTVPQELRDANGGGDCVYIVGDAKGNIYIYFKDVTAS